MDGIDLHQLLIYSLIYQTKGQDIWGQSVVSDALNLSLKVLLMGWVSIRLVAFCAVFGEAVSGFLTILKVFSFHGFTRPGPTYDPPVFRFCCGI